MARYLFVVPPLTGHVSPLRAVAAELRSRGHQVAWTGPVPEVTRLLGARETVYPAGDSAPFEVARRPGALRGFAALKFLWESYLVPLADAMVDGVAAAVEDCRPDALVVDQQALAGAVVAARTGLPWATTASTPSELSDPVSAMPKVAAWIDGLQQGLRDRHGVPATTGDLRFSPGLVLAFTTEALAGEAIVRPAGELRYVGAALADRNAYEDFPWERVRGQAKLVVVAFGTANGEPGARFLTTALRAFADLPPEFQVVIADPDGVVPAAASPNVLAVRWIPQLALIRRATAVVCHGGHNTVCESLSHGVPLVVAPIRDDQPLLAQQVVDSGAGVRLRFDRAAAEDIRDAVLEVCRTPSYAEQAGRLRESFDRAGGASAAADHLTRLVAAPVP